MYGRVSRNDRGGDSIIIIIIIIVSKNPAAVTQSRGFGTIGILLAAIRRWNFCRGIIIIVVFIIIIL